MLQTQAWTTRRRPYLAGAFLVLAVSLAACSSDPSPSPQANPDGGDPVAPGAAQPSAVVAGPDQAAQSDAAVRPTGASFADARGLDLSPPAQNVVGYAYHESLFPTALSLSPHGHPNKVDNPRFNRPKAGDGPDYVVMASRGRSSGPTTGVDVVLNEGATVVAPVTGEVVDASSYRLYCQTPDKRVIIRPDESPNERVVLFHLTDLQVKEGDAVAAGVTPLGHPRVFSPHSAQYDSYIPGGHPHVHVEVEGEPAAPLPGCPMGQ